MKTLHPKSTTTGKRARIDVALPLHEKAGLGIAVLAAANDVQEPRVLVRGNELVRMTEGGALEPLTTDALRDELSRAAQFERQGKDGVVPVDPPADVAKVVLSRDSSEYGDLPRVDRVVDVPVLAADDGLLTTPGYHPASRLYYRPAEGLEGVGPRDADSIEDVEWAKDLLLTELLGDFGFIEEADRAHALALVLLPFVRERIAGGSTPLHVVLAPDNGSGKTWLAQAALAPGCGIVAATPGTGSEEEWRKKITTMLLGGAPAVLLDNLSGVLDTGSLASALTSGEWADRLLGENAEVRLPVRNVWVATGNNLGLSAEMTRRAIAVFVDPGDRKPSERTRQEFRHPNLLEWATDHRRQLVEAALTLIDHWRRGPVGMVEGGYVYRRTGDGALDGGASLGSYMEWAAIIGGILEAAEIPGFLDNREKLRAEADSETREAREFLATWHTTTGGAEQKLSEVATLCQFGGPLHDVLPADLADAKPSRFNRALTTWLTAHRGQRRGGFVICSKELGGKGNPTGWYVQDRRLIGLGHGSVSGADAEAVAA